MFRTRWSLAALLVLPLVAAPHAVRADDLILPKVLTRRFPQGQFCALPVSISFTAPATPVVVTFTALKWVADGANGLVWTQQRIDNVSLATTAQVTPNYLPPPVGSSAEFCYNGDPVPTPYFRFNTAGLALDLLEQFDTSPFARGWSSNDGAWYAASSSAPRNVTSLTDASGGSLGLGDGTGTPVAGATASSSLTLGSLQPGVSYDLGAWWDAGFVHFPNDVTYLTVTVTTVGGTPVAQRSWGALKSTYR